MIEIKKDDIFNAKVDAIVNAVNCVGVMGKGLALLFKHKYPDNYIFYKKACDAGTMKIGKVLVFELNEFSQPKYIFNFPTKSHWKFSSTLEDIKKGLLSLIEEVNKLGIKSIAIPALGCGLGSLDWHQVRPLIIEAFLKLPEVKVHLYEPRLEKQRDQNRGKDFDR